MGLKQYHKVNDDLSTSIESRTVGDKFGSHLSNVLDSVQAVKSLTRQFHCIYDILLIQNKDIAHCCSKIARNL